MNKEKTLKKSITSRLNFEKNIKYVIQKIIVDFDTIQHLIANNDFICDYYDDYFE